MSINSMTNAALARRTDFLPESGVPKDLQSIATAAGAGGAAKAAGDGGKASPTDTALNVLFGYIPTEVVTVYVAVIAALPAATGVACPVPASWSAAFYVFLAITPIVVWVVFAGKLRGEGKPLPIHPAQWPVWEMCAATISFAAWAFALPNNPFLCNHFYNASLAAVAVLLVSTVLGLLAPLFSRQLASEG